MKWAKPRQVAAGRSFLGVRRLDPWLMKQIPLGRTPVYGLLSEADVQKIVDAIFRLMRETGVAFDPDPRVLDLFSDAGCDISADHVVRFETDFVKECLQSLAKSAKVWNRDGTDFLEMREGNTVFLPGMTCIKVFDLETGEPRNSTFDDLATITRVADALPNMDGVCVMVKDVPDSTLHGEIGEFVAMAENTSKPLEYLCQNSAAFDAVIEMAAAIRGGMDRLAEKPYFTQIVTPLPLYYAKTHSDQIMRAAECGIPVLTGTDSIGGAAVPYTIAGSMTHSFATDFAAVALSQLVRKGAFCAPCSDNIFLEPLRGNLGSDVPGLLADLATRQVMTHLGLLPMAGSGGGSRARRFNQDAAFQIAAGIREDVLHPTRRSGRTWAQSTAGSPTLSTRCCSATISPECFAACGTASPWTTSTWPWTSPTRSGRRATISHSGTPRCTAGRTTGTPATSEPTSRAATRRPFPTGS